MPLAAPPVHVSLPAARTDASVVPVGGSRSSGLELPADPRLVGWWAFGAAPGAAGSVVLAGHIDAYDRGVGTFAALTTVRVGAPVAVTDSRGQVHDYRVVARRTYRKERLPQSIYTATGLPRLVLVTCGGQFRHGHYDSNIVVYALPR